MIKNVNHHIETNEHMCVMFSLPSSAYHILAMQPDLLLLDKSVRSIDANDYQQFLVYYMVVCIL